MDSVGYAIIGVGYFGAELGRIMNEQEGAHIVAVLDPENGSTIAKEFNCSEVTIRKHIRSKDIFKGFKFTYNYEQLK